MTFIKNFRDHQRFGTLCDLCRKPLLSGFVSLRGKEKGSVDAFHFECYFVYQQNKYPPKRRISKVASTAGKDVLANIDKWKSLLGESDLIFDQVGLRKVL